MPTRRKLLEQISMLAAAAGMTRLRRAAMGQDVQGQHRSDDLTVNSAPQSQHYPPPDFGPSPAKLPVETEAFGGSSSLKAHAAHSSLIAGAAVVVRALQSDPALQQLVAEQYGILVPENELKWGALRPSEKSFEFEAADALFSFANQHGILVRGHALVWHNSVPDWLQSQSAKLDVRNLLVNHIRTVAGRYRGRVHSWDVVNEAILPGDKQPDGLRKSFWYDAIGPNYIELAFRTAREADPHAKLTYNDYGVECDSDEQAERRESILALLRRLQAAKVPLDAVGIQSHIKAGSPYRIGRGLKEYIASIRDMGLDVYLTEMDVNEDDLPFNDVAQRDGAVAELYLDFLTVALASPAVKLMLTWGVSDRRTWLNDGPTHHRKQPGRPQRSLPFDAAYRPKPAFFGIRDSFDARSTT
jgi:endo-1,4-beta-xylanase